MAASQSGLQAPGRHYIR
uniref:Uncharacterized protein n=1 Tax=Anguilla anguilla TaxID=7936 RepID=A0A0E9PHW4_ANGAN